MCAEGSTWSIHPHGLGGLGPERSRSRFRERFTNFHFATLVDAESDRDTCGALVSRDDVQTMSRQELEQKSAGQRLPTQLCLETMVGANENGLPAALRLLMA